MEDQRECEERSDSRTVMAVTMRICEHHVVALGKVRKQYYKYSLEEQKLILLNIIYHCELKGLNFTGIFYEVTELKGSLEGIKVIHFHANFEFSDPASYYAFKEHSLLLNKRYGPSKYIAFDYRFLLNQDDEERWEVYKKKDIKHSISEWTKDI